MGGREPRAKYQSVNCFSFPSLSPLNSFFPSLSFSLRHGRDFSDLSPLFSFARSISQLLLFLPPPFPLPPPPSEYFILCVARLPWPQLPRLVRLRLLPDCETRLLLFSSPFLFGFACREAERREEGGRERATPVASRTPDT